VTHMNHISRRTMLLQGCLAATAMTCKRRNAAEGEPDLHLTARIVEQDAQVLHLEWTLSNESLLPIVVLRHLIAGVDAAGRYLLPPDLAYVSVSEDGSVDVSKKILPLPVPAPNAIAFPPPPLGEELAAGQRISETLALPLPLKRYDPWDVSDWAKAAREYGVRPAPATPKVQSHVLRVHIGVYRPARAAIEQPNIERPNHDPTHPPMLVETSRGKLIQASDESTIEVQKVLDAPPIPWSGEAYRFWFDKTYR
jgi:hypothetical protein